MANTSNSVQFISYTGKYPCLCSGTLTLAIEGEEYKFGYGEEFRPFWRSGGCVSFSEDWYEEVTSGEWIISNVPAQFEDYAEEIGAIFNANVPYGCCGGCV